MNKEYGNGAQTFERQITKGFLNCNDDELDYLKSLINKFYLKIMFAYIGKLFKY